MKEIKRSSNESISDLVRNLEEQGIAPKGRILHIGPSNTVKNIAGRNTSDLPNIVGTDISLAAIFGTNKES